MEQLLQKQRALELETWRLTHATSTLLSHTRSLTNDMRVAQDTIAELQAQVQAQQQTLNRAKHRILQHPTWSSQRILQQFDLVAHTIGTV
jgi:putative NADPH-quinone reductase